MKTCPTCSASYGNDVESCPRDGSTLRSSGGLEPGTVIRKKYEILSEIGRGGMGVVYRARHLIWHEEKALKVLLNAGSEGRPGLQALLAEALVMRQLQHPNIVRVEDADYTEDDQAFVVMEYVDGQSLRQKLDRGGPLAPEVALQIAAQACSALSAAHKKGIIHRDIKPQNLLLAKSADGSETVKIIDFGIAKVREEAGLGLTGMRTSTTGLFVGTPGYASPEQANGMRGRDLDGRTDLYSLGLVLYEMLTGRLPFSADTPFALLVQRIQVPPMPLDLVRAGLSFSPDVSSLVMKALAKDRENRYRSAEEMERAILAVLEEREAATLATQPLHERAAPPAPEHKKSATTVPGKRELSQRWRIGSVIAVAALALMGIGFFITHALREKASVGISGAAAPTKQIAAQRDDKPAAVPVVEKTLPAPIAQASGKTAEDVPKQTAEVESDSRASAPPEPSTQASGKTVEDVPGQTAKVESDSRTSTPPPQSPSFDCAKAHTSVELLICRDGNLAVLEREMVSSFNKVLNALPDDAARLAFRQEHLAWFKSYSRTCKQSANDVDRATCIADFLSARTTEFKNRAAAISH